MNLFGKGGLNILKLLTNNATSLLAVSGVIIAVGVVSVGTSYRNVSNLNSGILDDHRLSANIARLNDPNSIFGGTISAQGFSGNLSGNATTATALAADPADCAAGAFASAIDNMGNLGCSYDGSSLANLNASSLSSGTVADKRLSSNVAFLNSLSNIFKGTVTATEFFGNLVGDVTGNISGTFTGSVADSALSSNIAKYNDATPTFANVLTAAGFSGDGSSLTGITGSQISGDISGNAAGFNGSLSGDVTGTQGSTTVSNVSCTNCVADGSLSGNVAKYDDPSPTFINGLTAASFSGDGANITNIDGSNVTSAVANATNSVNSTNVSGGTVDTVAITNSTIDSTVTGDGSSLTGVDAATLGSHSSAAFLLLDGTQLMTGDLNLGNNNITNVQDVNAVNLTGDGSGITNLASTQLTDSANLARLNAGLNGFTGELDVDMNWSSAFAVKDATGTTTFFKVDTTTPNVTINSDATVTGTLSANVSGALTGNASTATALATNPTDCASGDFATTIDAGGNLTCSHDGGSLVNVNAGQLQGQGASYYLNASHINAGTLGDSFLSSNVALKNALSNIFTGSITAASFSGDLTGNVTGNVSGSSGSTTGNAATATALAANPTDCAAGAFANAINALGNLTCSTTGSSLTALNASNISSGTLAIARIAAGSITDAKLATISTAGKVADTALSSNVAKYTDASPTFTNGLTAPSFTGSLVGNASTASKLQSSVNINGVAFDGSGAITVAADAGTLTGTTLASNVVSSSLTSVGTLANLTVTNPINGDITGNAATATALQHARTINGVSFDGTGNITITVDANNLTGTTLNSGIVNSSLTSVGTLSGLTATGTVDFSGATNMIAPTTAGTAGGACTQAGALAFNGTDFLGCDGATWLKLNP